MSTKEGACFRALKKYGLMIDGPKAALASIKRWPMTKEGETFNQWKQRVFQDDVEITVYAPIVPAQQTRMSTLARESGGGHLKKVFVRYGKFKDEKLNDAVSEAELEVVEMLSTFSKETLISLLEELNEEIEPSVEQFFERYIDSTDEHIDTENIMRDLIKTYNNVVCQFRNVVKI